MVLYILRHGRSPSAAEAGVARDADRPLDPAGREELRRAARYLREQGGRPSLALVSPLKRAQQTAAEVAQLLKPTPELRTYAPLSNAISGAELYRRLVDDELGADELLLIGHQPQLGELANYLTGEYYSLSPGGQIALETGAKGARLRWKINPDELR